MGLVQLNLEATPLFTNRARLDTNKTQTACLGNCFFKSRLFFFFFKHGRKLKSYFKFLEMSYFSHLKSLTAADLVFPWCWCLCSKSQLEYQDLITEARRLGLRETQWEPRKGKTHQTRCQEFLPRSVCLCGWAISPQSQRLLKHELSFAFQQTPTLIMWSGKQTCLGLS